MKRHKCLTELSKDHHNGLILAQIIKKDSPPYKNMPADLFGKKEYTSDFYNRELVKHFNEEEEILIPFVAGKDYELDKLCNQVKEEHSQIKSLMKRLNEKEDTEEILNEIGIVLEKHIRMEERNFFEMIQKVLDEKSLDELEQRLTRK